MSLHMFHAAPRRHAAAAEAVPEPEPVKAEPVKAAVKAATPAPSPAPSAKGASEL